MEGEEREGRELGCHYFFSPSFFFFFKLHLLTTLSTSLHFACRDLDVLPLQIGHYDFVDSVLKPCLGGGKGEGIYMQIKFYPLMDLHSQHVPQHTIISIYIRHSDHISEAFIFHPLKSVAIRIRFHILMRARSQQYRVSHCFVLMEMHLAGMA